MSRTRLVFRALPILFAALPILFAGLPSLAQTPRASSSSQTARSPDPAEVLKTTDAYVRNLFAWGPDFKVNIGPLSQSAAADFYLVPVRVSINDQTDTGEVYVSKDGKTLVRGEMFDMSIDPFAANRAKLHIEGNPSKGPADAPVTLVEFADFECPHCRELDEALKGLEGHYRIRLVYKDFPLAALHPWADTAAIGARCAFIASPEAFWKVHDVIFEKQDLISAENVWDKLAEFASQAGLDKETFKSCMSSPEARRAVEANHDEGVALSINSTPTLFVNGRPVVGGDISALQHIIEFELAAHSK
jgi:protein-disulfide isomerase